MRRMFAVGRVDRKTTEVRLVERGEVERPGGPFRSGPFTLTAVVRSTGPRVRLERS